METKLAVWLRGIFFLLVALQFAQVNVHAAKEMTGADLLPTAAEYALLPPYCRSRIENIPGPEFKRWETTLGANFMPIHHYCFALNWLNRAQFKTGGNANLRKRYVHLAMNDLDYLLSNTRPEITMVPDYLTLRAKAYLMIGEGAKALPDLERAISLKPEAPAPYAQLADYYIDKGQKAQAKVALESGLEKAPQSTALNRRYKELTGKVYVPVEPVAKQNGEGGTEKDATKARPEANDKPISQTPKE